MEYVSQDGFSPIAERGANNVATLKPWDVATVAALKAIEDQQIELKTATVDTSAAEVAALRSIDTAAMNAQNYLLSEIRTMRSTLLDMLANLDGVVTLQEAQIRQAAATADATLDEQRKTTSAAAATAAATSAAASAPAAVS